MSSYQLALAFGCELDLDEVPKTNSKGEGYFYYPSFGAYMQTLVQPPCGILETGDLKKENSLKYFLSLPVPPKMNYQQIDQWLEELNNNETWQEAFFKSMNLLGQKPVKLEDLQLVPCGTFV